MGRLSAYSLIAILACAAASCRLIDNRPVFRYRAGAIATLDPAAASDHASVRESARAYQTPMRLERRMGNIIARPWLLGKAPSVEDDGRRLELEFRKDVRFHESALFDDDSREVTACDWVKSILRHGDPRVGSHWQPYLSKRIVGFREWAVSAAASGDAAYAAYPPGLSCAGNIASVRLRMADPEFAYFLGHPAASVLPVDEILRKRWDVGEKPVGSGDFTFFGSRVGRIFWRSGNAVSPLRGLEVDTTRDGARDWERFVRGGLDLIELPRELQSEMILPDGELVEKWKDRGFQLQKIQRADLVFVGFQMRHPVLGKKRGVRQAMARALAAGPVAEKAFGGRAIEAYSAIPPGIPGYYAGDPRIPRAGDLGPAQDILGFNGHPHGRGLPEFRMACLPHLVEQELCRSIAARWELIGIRVAIVPMDEASRRAGILDGSVHLWIVTWVADLPGAITHLEIFDPEMGLPEIPSPDGDLAGYRRALARARMSRLSGRTSPVTEATAILRREAPAAFLLHRFQYWLVRPGIFGLNWQDFAWHEMDELRKLDSDDK